MNVQRTPALVVGGGLVGLSASHLLTHHGVPHVLVEKHQGTAIQPKARRFNFRTMEVFRAIGLADVIYEAARDLADFQAMRKGSTLIDSEEMPSFSTGDLAALESSSPCDSALIAQDSLEPLLRKAAVERGGDIRFGTELVTLEEDADGVTAKLADGSTIRADYVIAADGARSPIREALGIGRTGRGVLGVAANIYFRADLGAMVNGREFNLCFSANGAFASVDGRYRWLFMTSRAGLTPEQSALLVREEIGAPADVEVLSVLDWEPTMKVASTFATERIFLAGDAAHVMPPYAAMGANTGIQDVHNLAWKLARVLQGQASADLLSTYDKERQPLGYFTAEQSVLFGEKFGAPGGGPAQEPVHPLALVAGYQYTAGALTPDGTEPAPMDRLELTGKPGTRVPHSWLDAAETVSTVDLANREFALLTRDPSKWRNSGQAVHLVPEAFAELTAIGEHGALVVRPDGTVGARHQGR